jgi:TrmH family RNA methyltransferase
MLSKNQISFINSLQQKKFRKQEGLFIAEGEKIVDDLLASSFVIKKIIATSSYIDKYSKRSISSSTEEWIEVSDAELKKISTLTTPNKVFAVAEIPSYAPDEKEISQSLSLVLDCISDPGNLGTIIRVADWFGIKNIICSSDTADCYNSKVVQASMGSLFRTKIHYVDLEDFLEKNRVQEKLRLFAMMLEGENIYTAELPSTGLIILGNEAGGVRSDLTKYFSKSLLIPSYRTGEDSSADSLNVAIAAAIVCSEFRRRSESLNK